MSSSNENMNTGAQQCSFAQLIGTNDKQRLCSIQETFDDVHVCYGCGRYSTAIPTKSAQVLEDCPEARMLVASFTSCEIIAPNWRPLSLVAYRHDRQKALDYAVMADGDPDFYECRHLKFSGGLSMTVRNVDLQDAAKAEPRGKPFQRELVEAVQGPLNDEENNAVEKLLANGWSFIGAERDPLAPGQGYLSFWKGHECKYTHPDGTVNTMLKGISAHIELKR